MFVDRVKLTLSSGKGGMGAVSFRREKFVIKGGPDGGDGGRGGNVFIEVDNNTHTLAHFKGKTHLKAQNGRPGEGRKKYGKYGEDLIVKVPPGTQIIDEQTGELLLDMCEKSPRTLFLEGGKGGLGNAHFKSSTNQRPSYAQPGLAGESKEVRLELKLIADVGLVGFPNVGKSTLISAISNARPEIANYEFTTLTPKLGVVNLDQYNSFVMADIPGIIEGASDGKGLGLEFLRHIERTEFLLFMIDISNYRSSKEQFESLKIELEKYSDLLAKRTFAIALSKCDTFDEEELQSKLDEFQKNTDVQNAKFILPISAVSGKNIDQLKNNIYKAVYEEDCCQSWQSCFE